MALALVVEDNPQNLKLVTVILRSAGHTVIPAVDASEAEEAIRVRRPDIILMDLGLPVKDGYTLIRELRARPDTARTPILAVSSFAMKGDEEKARAIGCSDYLTKPIDRRLLLARVRSLLGPLGDAAPPPP